MEEHKPNDQGATLTHSQQQFDELNCPTRNRKRWAIDRSSTGWHAWLPLHDRPQLRWALAIVLAIIIIAVMVVGIVYTTEYYAMYYATGRGGWLWDTAAGRSNNDSNDLMRTTSRPMDLVQSYPNVVWHSMNKEEDGDDTAWTVDQRYRPMILQMAPCIEKYSCAQYDRPVGEARETTFPYEIRTL